MHLETSETNPCTVVLKASLDPEEVKQVRSQVVENFARTSRVPGFRPGKAPTALVATRFAKEIGNETEERLFRLAWDKTLHQHNYRPAGALGIKEVTWQEDGSFTFVGEFEVYPSLQLVSLSDFQPPSFSLEPREEDVEQFLRGLAERHATWQGLEEGTATDGLLVEAEIEGEFPNGGGDPFREELVIFELGAGEVYPEIETAVRGLQIGEEAEATRELPGSGDAEPTSVRYKIKVKGLRRKVVPEVDDELARQMNVEGGLPALRERARELLRQTKKQEHQKAMRQALINHLAGAEPIPLPSRVVEEETRRAAVNYAESLHRHGADEKKVNWQEVLPNLKASVEARLREELVLDHLADLLGVAVTNEEVDAAVRRHAEEAGLPYAETRGNLMKSGGLARIRAILRRERAVAQALAPWLGEG